MSMVSLYEYLSEKSPDDFDKIIKCLEKKTAPEISKSKRVTLSEEVLAMLR